MAILSGVGLRDWIGITRMGWGGGPGCGRAFHEAGSGLCLLGVGLNWRVEWYTRWPSSIRACDRFLDPDMGGSASSVPSSPKSTNSEAAGSADCCCCGLGRDCTPPRAVTCEGNNPEIVATMNRLVCILTPVGGKVTSLSSGFNSNHMESFCNMSSNPGSPPCKAALRSLPCLAVFRFG